MAADHGLPWLRGDAGAEDDLLRAGLLRAASLVACTADDAENVLITLTAKGLNPSVFVVARLKAEENDAKARRAGADRVIAPSAIGGRRIAALIARPYVVEFLDVVTHGARLDLVLEEVVVGPASALAGCSLRQAQLRDRYGATVLAIRGPEAALNTRPTPNDVLHAGDVLVVIGAREDLDRLQLDAA
jgi:voltage-gated potassium channel